MIRWLKNVWAGLEKKAAPSAPAEAGAREFVQILAEQGISGRGRAS